MRTLRLVLAIAGLPILAPSQAPVLHLPSDTPSSGTCSTAPFGSQLANAVDRQQHWQMLVTAAELGNAPRTISSLGFAACGSGTRSYSRLVVLMKHRVGALTTDMTANLGGGATTMLDVVNHSFAHAADVWTNLGMSRSFAFDPAQGDLLIDIRVVNADFVGTAPGFHTAARAAVLANNYSGAAPQFGTLMTEAPKLRLGLGAAFIDALGTGCGPAPLRLEWSGTSVLGGTASFWFTGARAGVLPDLAALWVGAQRVQTGLTGIGAPGCVLHASLDFSAIVSAASGTSTALVVPFPNVSSLAGARVYVQGAHVDGQANALGVVLSGAAIAVMGN